MSAGDASTVEQRALRTSLWVSIGFAVIAAVWGLLARSEVILLDAVFTPLYLLMTLGSLIVSRVVAKGPSRMYPFGRHALAPLFVTAQAIILVGALAYAILEAIRVILDGGSEVAGATLLAYGLVSALVSLITWRVLLRMARDRPLVKAEAAGWFSAVPSSAVIAVGGVIVLLLDGTRSAGAAPYVDPALVIIACLGFAVIPVNLLRGSLRDLQTARPDAELVAEVETVVENVRTAEGLPEPILRVGRLGAILDVALAFVLPTGTGEISSGDRVRRAVRDGLSDLPYNAWITVEFGYDAELFESKA
ncbi:MAG: cation transporter [Nocardiopsaceae bacterium]|jgi:predicted Co/Zn/Cd cation transporter (cation efflux family)|nr:cation transporter [Nocardiopsaceae bacterium]